MWDISVSHILGNDVNEQWLEDLVEELGQELVEEMLG